MAPSPLCPRRWRGPRTSAVAAVPFRDEDGAAVIKPRIEFQDDAADELARRFFLFIEHKQLNSTWRLCTLASAWTSVDDEESGSVGQLW